MSARRRWTAACLLCLLAACSGNGEFDRTELERVEDVSEQLANDLLALSVAVRDRSEGVERYFTDSIRATALPLADPASEERIARWIVHRKWTPPDDLNGYDRAGFLDTFKEMFWRYSEIDDVRFKVKNVEFEGSNGRAHIKFFVVGRDERGRREWLKGLMHADVTYGSEGPWRLASFELDHLEAKVSETDLFSEVGFPAGVAEVFPAFGVGANQGFISHGAATADVDGDGLLDLAASGVDQNYLYRNRGDGTFEDISAEALVKFAPIGAGALFLDFDNDGDPDLFFAAVGRQVLLENRRIPDGETKFWDISEQAGIALDAVGFSAVAADVNADGLPDIYVCSYNRYGTVMPNSWHRATNGTPNLLFINRGGGTFEEASLSWGVDDGRWSYAAGFIDIDEDGDQDLYVANDFGENALYRNDSDKFTDVAEEMGLKDPGFGMGVSFGDYDNDGRIDLHVTNMSSTAGNRILQLLYPEQHEIRKTLSKQAAGNSLYRNEGGGKFREVTDEVGGLSGGWAFGGGFLDFDNDGHEDLFTPNGFVSGKSMKDT